MTFIPPAAQRAIDSSFRVKVEKIYGGQCGSPPERVFRSIVSVA